MPQVTVNGCHFHYESRGNKGPALVLVHGENHGLDYFEFQLAHFAQRYRCVAYVRRGHAGTQETSYGYSLHNQTVDLAGLIEQLNLDRPVVVAIAFGSAIALNLALEFPAAVRAIAMEGWSEVESDPAYREHFVRQTPRVVKRLQEGGPEALVQMMLSEGNGSFPVLPQAPRLREAYARMFASRPRTTYDKRLEFVSSVPNLLQRFGEICLPVLGIDGAHDPFPAHPELLESYPNFREVKVPDCGRFVHWEQPELFNSIVEDFIEGLASGSHSA